MAIEMTAIDLGPPGWDPEYGWGVIDAAAAVRHYGTGNLDVSPGAVRRQSRGIKE